MFTNVNIAFIVGYIGIELITLIIGIANGEIEMNDLINVIVVILIMVAIVFLVTKAFSWNFYTCFCIAMFIGGIIFDLFIDH